MAYGMSFTNVVEQLRTLRIDARREGRLIRVQGFGQRDNTAYLTDETDDAYHVGVKMASAIRSNNLTTFTQAIACS